MSDIALSAGDDLIHLYCTHTIRCSAETNTTDIQIFVRFALFEHNLCYSTTRLRPCGFAYMHYLFDHLELGCT